MRSPQVAQQAALVLVSVLSIFVASASTSCSRVDAAPRGDGERSRAGEPSQLRVVWTEDPQTTATISWSTDVLGTNHVVHFDTKKHGRRHSRDRTKLYPSHVQCLENGRYTGDPEKYYHHARLTELEPDTQYFFVLDSDGGLSREFWFRTAPADDQPVKFLQGGDSRSGHPARQSVNDMMARLAKDDPDILCIAHGGDYVKYGTKLKLWMKWLDDHQRTIAADGRVLPIVPTRGNHEAKGEQFDEVFGAPGGGIGKNWFATKLSAEILLVTLNTETAHGGPQADFLAAVAKREESTRWMLAQYHRPMFPAVKKPTRAKPHWQPIFDEARFDIILENDGHTLRRTVPILGEEKHEDGVVYIGEGGFGVRQRKPDTSRWYLADPGFAASAHHVWKVTLTEHTVECSAIGLGDKVIHEFHRTARTRKPKASPSEAAPRDDK